MNRVTEDIAFSNIYKKYKYNKYNNQYYSKYSSLTNRQKEIYKRDYHLAICGYDYETIENMLANEFSLPKWHIRKILNFISKFLISKLD
jgi:hypothetical protein